MVEYVGNAIPAPGFAQGGWTTDDELLFSYVGYSQKGVTLKPGQGVLLLGTLIKQDPTSKQYIKATDDTAQGVLRTTTDTGAEGSHPVLGNIVTMGQLKLAKMQAANSGVTLTSVLGARVDAVQGYFKF